MLVWKTALDLAPRCPAVNRPKTRILRPHRPLPKAPRRVVGEGRRRGIARGPDHRTARRPPLRPAPGARPRARRQVDLAPLPHVRRAGRRARPASPACSKARTSSTPARRCGRWAPTSNAPGEGAWRVNGVGRCAACAAGSAARFRQCRHRLPPDHGAVARLPDHRDLRRRRLAAHAADGARARSAASDGRAGARASPTAAACRSRCAGARDPIPIVYRAPVASAQVKSAVLLAGLNTPGDTTVIEPEATRDHTEKMLRHFGAERARSRPKARTAAASRSKASPSSRPRQITVPADPSSAAFPLVAGADRAGLGHRSSKACMTEPDRAPACSRRCARWAPTIEVLDRAQRGRRGCRRPARARSRAQGRRRCRPSARRR